MAQMSDIVQGLTILLRYGDGQVAAEHDQFFAGPNKMGKDDISEEDRKILETLRWYWDEDFDCWRRYV